MLYFLMNNGKVVHVTSESPYTGTPKLKEFPGITYDEVADRWDWKSLDEVKSLAQQATELTGEVHLGVDHGDGVSPRFDVIAAPKIGNKVSKGFNGDYYPCGEIVKITPSWQVTTSTGEKFRRVKESGGWRQTGRSSWMVDGHIDERNPHF